MPKSLPKDPVKLKEKKPKITPFWMTRREKRTFRIDNQKAWDLYWELVWKRGKIKIKNPNKRTRARYPKISIGYLIHEIPSVRRRVMEDFHKWKELNIEGLLVAKYPNALHKGTHLHLEAQKLNPEVSGLHKGDRYYGIVEELGEGEFEVQLYDVRSGKPLRRWTIPRVKLEEYEARYHPWTERKKDISIQARVANRWLLEKARSAPLS